MQARFSRGSLAVAWIARYAALLDQHTESVPSVVGTTVVHPALPEPPVGSQGLRQYPRARRSTHP